MEKKQKQQIIPNNVKANLETSQINMTLKCF